MHGGARSTTEGARGDAGEGRGERAHQLHHRVAREHAGGGEDALHVVVALEVAVLVGPLGVDLVALLPALVGI